MMWFFLLLCIAHIQPVIVQDNPDRLILKNGTNPCEGHIEIYHNGIWGYVGDTNWNRSIEEVVCRSAHCGTPESTEYVLRPLDRTVWLDDIKCDGGESHLWQCQHPGWNISYYPQDIIRMVKCSNKVEIHLEESECAGAVKYSTYGGKSSGYICSENWEKSAADLLCRNQGCGNSKDHEIEGWIDWKAFKGSAKMKTKCLDAERLDNLWQCVTEEHKTCPSPAFVTCEKYERLQLKGNSSNVCQGQLEIEKKGSWNPVTSSTKLNTSDDVWCKHMHCGDKDGHSWDDKGTQLTCTDKVSVALMNNKTKCYGEVHIIHNDISYPVCGSSWTKEDAEVVCRELNCGNVVFSDTKSRRGAGIMDNVACTGKESSLWHCRARRDKSFQLPCTSTAYVVCGDSMDVRLMDAPAKCAGRVEIQYEGEWQRAGKNGWEDENSDTVCTLLNCGKNRPANEKFSPGSGKFLDKVLQCKAESSHISECFGNEERKMQNEAVSITCEDYKVVFLQGDESCSGRVGIEQGDETYWLSGSNQTWNQESANTVCRQSQCGEARLPFSSIPSGTMAENVWNESYSCSPNTTSLFECEKNMTLPSNHSESIAYVNCTGNIKVTLTKGCWGNVDVCVGKDCGGVCKETWTDDMSRMLCKDLNCGNIITPANGQSEESKVIFLGVHIPESARNMNQSIFVWKGKEDTRFNREPAQVVCSGSVKLQLDSRYKCSGNVKMTYQDRFVPVCKKALENNVTQNIICEELNCGHALKAVAYFGPKSARAPVISGIECLTDGDKSLQACSMTLDTSDCDLGGLRCSGWSKTELKFDKACSGAVFIHSETNTSAVKNEDLTEAKGEEFCKELNCGKFKSYKNSSITFSQEQLRFIECQGEPSVTLSKNCGGEVMINNVGVCSTTWTEAYSNLVCKERGCNKVITTDYNENKKTNMEYYHVTCENYHHKLGQCSTFKGKCANGPVSVYCVDNVKFKTKETCGGWIEINYQNKWEKVCPSNSFPPAFQNELCAKIDCGGHNESLRPKNKDLNKQATMAITLDCTGVNNNIKYCIRSERCNKRPADIYCDGYVPKTVIVDKTDPPIVAIILGIGFTLLLVILIAVFVRFYIFKRAKKPISFPSRIVPRGEEEFESGEFENITNKENEMEDISPGTFRPEARVITESDVRSTSSFSYDDIDERAEAQPLTSRDPTAGALGHNYINEDAIRQSLDNVNYEVEDPPENYDDIDASPVASKTKAEVHESPQNTTEGIAVATPGSVLGDKEYLVSGQDG